MTYHQAGMHACAYTLQKKKKVLHKAQTKMPQFSLSHKYQALNCRH